MELPAALPHTLSDCAFVPVHAGIGCIRGWIQV